MNRLLVAFLAAFDAAIAVAVGIAAVLAPLTLLWVFGLGDGADWSALWPAAVTVWQAGHFVPLHVALGDEYAAIAGIPADAATFVFSLAPLALAVFTAIFAARSGARAAHAGAWSVGVVTGTVTVAALASVAAATAVVLPVRVEVWQAVLLPTLVFASAALGGALVRAWREGDGGAVDALRARIGDTSWGEAVAPAARGAAVALVGFIGLGAAVTALGLIVRGGEVIALFEAAHVDLVGVIVLAIGQLAYLPTLIVWGAAYAAGPGVAIGVGTTVSPAGTDLGVLPGIPILGIVPDAPPVWLLLLALAVVGVGFLAGWTVRTRLSDGPAAVGARSEAVAPRLAALGILVVIAALGAAVLAQAAAGAIGPERLQEVGPSAGAVALAFGIEVAVGAAIALFSPLRSAPTESASERRRPAVDARPFDIDAHTPHERDGGTAPYPEAVAGVEAAPYPGPEAAPYPGPEAAPDPDPEGAPRPPVD